MPATDYLNAMHDALMNSRQIRDQWIEQPLPSNDEAERMLLGAILLDTSRLSEVAAEVEPDDFYSPFHRQVYFAMLLLMEQQRPIEVLLIAEQIKQTTGSDVFGGAVTIANLSFGLPHFTDIAEYIGLVAEKARLRKIAKACNAAQQQALEGVATSEMLALGLQSLADEITTKRARSQDGFIAMSDIVRDEVLPNLARLERGEHNKMPTGFPALDNVIGGGIASSDVLLFAGLTSSGKSSLALQIAYQAAAAGYPAAFCAGEMTNCENVNRILSQLSGTTNINSLTHINHDEKLFIEQWADSVKNVPLFFDSRTSDLTTIGNRLRALKVKHGIRLFVLDYIQLFKLDKVERRQRVERIAEVSQEAKRLANELDIAIILVAQFNREGAKSGEPTMFDLEGSSQLEKDASIIAFILRRDDSSDVTIKIVKGRNTGKSEVAARFIGRCVKFEFD